MVNYHHNVDPYKRVDRNFLKNFNNHVDPNNHVDLNIHTYAVIPHLKCTYRHQSLAIFQKVTLHSKYAS